MQPDIVRNKLYVSQSGFLWGDQPVTTYDSGCLRSIGWVGANRDLRGSIPIPFAMVGSRHESNHSENLEVAGLPYHRELPMAETIPDKDFIYSGRCDFILPGSIDETKGTFSKSAPTYILRKGAWKVSHLAQLVGYLWMQEFKRGRIVVGVYSFHPEDIFTGTEYHHVGTRIFEIEVADDGQISIDHKLSPYYVQDQLAHVMAAADVLKSKKVWPVRPYGWNAKWSSPCHFCKFKSLCDDYDKGGMSDEETFPIARKLLGDSK